MSPTYLSLLRPLFLLRDLIKAVDSWRSVGYAVRQVPLEHITTEAGSSVALGGWSVCPALRPKRK